MVTTSVNFVLAMIWLVLGVVLLAFPQAIEGQPWAGRLMDNRQLLGGVCIVLAVYNIVRLQSIRAFYRDREAIDEAIAERHRLLEEHRREEPEPPSPAFNFDEPKKPKPPHDLPPSNN
jgi:hypothetical protein